MEEGPTQGLTAMPCRWAMSTTLAPGSATAGQPASETSPISAPFLMGSSQALIWAASTLSLRVWMVISWSGRVVPISLRNARAVLAFSAM
jgi:hypothetical protein